MTGKTLRGTLEMALEALIEADTLRNNFHDVIERQKAVEALRAALTLPLERKPFTASQREHLYLNADADIFHSMTLAAFHRVVQYVEVAQ